jgi:hypothetical protein
MDKLDFVKTQLARLPTRRDQVFTPLRIVVLTAFSIAAASHPLVPVALAVLRYCRSGSGAERLRPHHAVSASSSPRASTLTVTSLMEAEMRAVTMVLVSGVAWQRCRSRRPRLL